MTPNRKPPRSRGSEPAPPAVSPAQPRDPIAGPAPAARRSRAREGGGNCPGGSSTAAPGLIGRVQPAYSCVAGLQVGTGPGSRVSLHHQVGAPYTNDGLQRP